MALWPAVVAVFATAVYANSPQTSVAGALVPVDQAFPARPVVRGSRLVVRFDVLPGHYLYRDRFEATVDGQPAVVTPLTRGSVRDDPHFGRVEVYDQPTEIALALPHDVGSRAVPVAIRFQGCSERAGVCYPPVTRTYRLQGQEVTAGELPRAELRSSLRKWLAP
ncbi:MAG: protein-disulfide reductase DsbD family protein [Casimicrobiaceae bacterium]|nr:protein-disulfide reductase DsbD family protein [Casimicrobiaceae bacterium]MCX8097595.1 protein-disulfide reductase DsbD family protein [Casimicrobiaceae bacterium]MDW8312099.1 protein-disulfide reductase DsbD family protein [Burkholderiales bacterium]